MAIEMIIWLVAGECNLNCIHCYASRFRGLEAMSLDDALRFIEEISDYGVEHVALTGGEPLLRRDLREIIKAIRDHGMSCNMSTNLTCLNRELAEFLGRYDVYLYVSLDGSRPETYERIRGHGNWRYFMRGIELLKEYGVSFSTVMAVCKYNYMETKDYVRLAEKIGAESSCIIPVLPVGRAKENDVAPSREETIRSVKLLEEACNELGYNGLIWCYTPAELLIDSPYIYVTGGCRTDRVVDVDPAGNLLLCDTLDYRIANVKDGFINALREYYSDELVKRVMNPKLPEPCRSCRLREICRGGCYARSLLLRGGLDPPDPYCPLVSKVE